MTEFPIERRNLLRAAGGGALFGSSGARSISAYENNIAEGLTVYVGSQWKDDKMYAVDAETGEEIWSYNQGIYTPYAAPTAVDGTVYIGYDNGPKGSLHAINAATGEAEWVFEAGHWVRTSPTVVEGTVYVGSHDKTLYAVDAETGEQNWAFTQPDSPLMLGGGPAVADGRVFTGTKTGNLYAVDAGTGEQIWEFTQSDGGDPTLYQGTVYLGGDGSLYAVNAETGEEEWVFNPSYDGVSAPTAIDDTIYIGTGRVHAVDGSTGELKWESTEIGGVSSPTVQDGVLYAGTGGGTLYAFDANTGDPIWEFDNPNGNIYAPTAYEDTVYIGSKDNTLYAVEAETGEQSWEFNGASHYVRVPTVVKSPADGDSVGSRVNLGTLGHHHVWAGGGPPNPNPTGTVAGNADGPTGEPIDTGTAYLVDPIYKGEVINYVSGEGSLPQTEAETAIDGGTFLFEEVETGQHLVVVDPPDPFDPRYADVSVQADETATVSLTISAERYLAPLDSEFDALTQGAKDIVADSTADLTPVYVDGAQLFDDELDEGDFLPGMLATTAFAFGLASGGSIPISTQVASFAAGNAAITFAEHGHNHVLEEKVKEVEDTEFQNDLESYASQCLSQDWITNMEEKEAESVALDAFKGTPMYQSALDEIDAAADAYDNEAFEEPADDFSFTEVQSVLKEQVRWIENNGVAPGVLITPQGSGYVTRETRYHAAHYDGVRAKFDTVNTLKNVSTGIFIVGKGATIVGAAGGVTAVVGAVIAAVGAVGNIVFSMFQPFIKNELATAWVDTLMYWLSDLDDAPALLMELVTWISSEAETPTLQSVDGTIDSTDLGGVEVNGTTFALANRPDYPFWWPFFSAKPLWRRKGTYTVSVTNTGSVETNFQMVAVDTYGDDGSGGVSDAVSMYPQDFGDEGPLSLAPGDSAEIEFEYTSNFHPFDPFNWHYMSTSLWMNGKAVAEVQDPYYIVPSFDLLPLADSDGRTLDPEEALSQGELEMPIRTDEYLLTDASTSPRGAMTVNDWTDNVGEITLLEEGTVDPEEQTLSLEYQVPTDVRGVVFMLTSPMGAELNLSAENAAGQYVGYDPDQGGAVVEIPTAEYNGPDNKLERISIAEASGAYTVEAEAVEFLTADQASVSVYAAEVPERDASLAVSPGRADVSVKPGGSESTTIEIAEAGNQVGIEVTDVSVGAFETPQGEELTDADVSFSATSISLPAGEEASIELTVDADSSIDLPDGSVTRFWSELTIETANAGTAVLDTSILIFDTDVEGVQLTQAGPDVEGVSLAATGQVPSEPPEDVDIIDQYDIEVIGGEGVSLSFPLEKLPENEKITAYRVDDGDWTELETAVGNRIGVDLPASGATTLALTTVQVAPSALPGYDKPPQDLDGDGLYEDVDGDGTFDIFDVQALFENLNSDAVQQNAEAFNFDGDGPVDIFDVQALFKRL